MPELDIQGIQDELNAVASVFTADWAKIKTWATGKIVECGLTNGLTSYTLNGRTFANDVQFFERLIKIADEQIGRVKAPGGIISGYGGFRNV